jgi:hypothetical protein
LLTVLGKACATRPADERFVRVDWRARGGTDVALVAGRWRAGNVHTVVHRVRGRAASREENGMARSKNESRWSRARVGAAMGVVAWMAAVGCGDDDDRLPRAPEDRGECPYVGDGMCDEPNICPAGTDVEDCTGPGECSFTNDGMCDEPDLCPPGTDVDDCTGPPTCEYTNDGFCDEPELCPPGTDEADCSSCPYTNDGECDEPEGTGLCAEGTDSADC